jgi:hypothetical protein
VLVGIFLITPIVLVALKIQVIIAALCSKTILTIYNVQKTNSKALASQHLAVFALMDVAIILWTLMEIVNAIVIVVRFKEVPFPVLLIPYIQILFLFVARNA